MLWALYDATGIRPEWVLPVLYAESGFHPEALNGAGYSGINQASTDKLTSMGIDPADYRTWPASAQFSRVVAPMLAGLVRAYGPLRSGTRVYQANFLPATLATAVRLQSVLASQASDPRHWYRDNASLDWRHVGVIRVSDLAHSIEDAAMSPAVVAAIAAAYRVRANELPTDPVLGNDFGVSLTHTLMALAGGAGVAYAVDQGALSALGRWWRSLFR
jgi:hypothetical protein